MSKSHLTIGTRGSNLALWQANHIADLLREANPQLKVNIQVIRTKGDKILDVALSKIGDKGLFTKELERALAVKDVDLCVHSMKDMPTMLPEGLDIACMPVRADVRDALIGFNGLTFSELPTGARVATGSLRRTAQLAAKRPDIELCEIRGNVETRIGKVRDGQFDATILAVSGVERLGLDDIIIERFSPDFMIPAVGQGAIGVEVHTDDEATREILATIADAATMRDVAAECYIMRKLEGGCQVPIGAYAREESGKFLIDAFVSSLDGKCVARASVSGNPGEALSLAADATSELLAQGAASILEAIR